MNRGEWGETRLRRGLGLAADLLQVMPAVVFAAGLVVVVWTAARVAMTNGLSRWAEIASYVGLGFFLGSVLQSLAILGFVRRLELLRGYTWETAEYTFEIDGSDHRRHVNSVKISVRATRRGVRVFENRYFWTGKGEEMRPAVLNAGHSLLGAPHHDNNWMHYYVYLGRELARGERETIEVRQEFFDREDMLNPIHSKTVRERVGFLTIRTKFPSGGVPRRAVLNEYRRDEPNAKLLRRTEVAVDTRTGEVEAKVFRPRLRRRYEVAWFE